MAFPSGPLEIQTSHQLFPQISNHGADVGGRVFDHGLLLYLCLDEGLVVRDLLQCRPQVVRGQQEPVDLPGDVPVSRHIFSAHSDVDSGSVHSIEFVVLIDPRDYNRTESTDRKLGVARVVRQLNERLSGRRFILMGPGRWGTRDVRMGIRVGYADINNCSMLIEIARPVGGFVPEVSFGSHFFQDLVESRIRYLPLYPEEEGVLFNEKFLHGSRNVLPSLVPEAADYADVVRVIDVATATCGLLLNVDMSGEAGEALAYLVERRPDAPRDQTHAPPASPQA